MKKPILLIVTAIVLLAGAKICNGQTPAIGRSWKFVATQMPDSWYGSDESKAVAENVLLYQRDAGGWPKNIAMHKPLTVVEKATITDEKGNNDAILDNDATTTEMRFMARMYSKTKTGDYKVSFNRGLSFIYDAQYSNG